MPPSDLPPEDPHDRKLEAAAERFLRARRRGGPASAGTDHPGDPRADAAVARAWAGVGQVGSSPEIMALRKAALENRAGSARAPWRRRLSSGAMWPQLAAAAVVLMMMVSGAGYVWSRMPKVYETPVGERRVITLADNSQVFLDQDSRVSVTYSGRFRDLRLLKGQAEFDVAKDPLRPFSVVAAGRRVVATGTLFNIDILDRQLIVTLVRGSVVVAKADADAAASDVIPLKPSERLVVERGSGSVRKTNVDVADTGAWKLGKLVFAAEPLDQAVARVNRYGSQRIALAATGQARQPISGVFNVGDTAAFAEAVGAQVAVRAETRGGVVTLVPR